MEEDEVFLSILDGLVKKSREEMERTGNLSMENAWPILLKGQYNHIKHLDEDVSRRLVAMDEKIDHLDKDVSGRLVAMDEKIDGLRSEMDQRFDGLRCKMDRQFDQTYGVLTSQTRWMVGTMIAMSGIFMAMIKFMLP